jgi:hypothetical protein
MLIVRRTLLLWSLFFWQGGFFFYSAVVVKVGTDLNGMFEQGLITREVAIWLNVAGAGTLLFWIVDLLLERRACVKRRWFAWSVMLACLVALVILHPLMNGMIEINSEHRRILNRADFRNLHRWYLWISTAQWIAAIFFTLWTVQNWRAVDRRSAIMDER